MYGDLTIEKLATNTYQAHARNKLIAEAFYLTADIEKYGSGFQRIRNEIATYPTMDFKYEEVGNGFLVTLSYRSQKITTDVQNGGKVGDKITENQIQILENMKKDPTISANELGFIVGISKRKIETNISKLKAKGLLKRIGASKGGYWEILKEINEK